MDTLGAEAQAPQARPAPATPEQQRRGKQLVAQAVAAHGGTAKLKAIRHSELEGELHQRLRAISSQPLSGMRIRCHGDYHLGQQLE